MARHIASTLGYFGTVAAALAAMAAISAIGPNAAHMLP
jgi:hypothetical protein